MIWEKQLGEFRDELASLEPTPGGGSAAGVAAVLGAALLSMALEVSVKRDPRPQFEALRNRLRKSIAMLSHDAEKDVVAYQSYAIARDLPKRTQAELDMRAEAIDTALEASAEAPAMTAEHILEALALGAELLPIVRTSIRSDVGAGKALLCGALEAALATLDANLPYFKDESIRQKFIIRKEALLDRKERSLQEWSEAALRLSKAGNA